jgi:acyl-[acyl-carrier-protein]-phospholipid O-acyltransferase / long-chain-fatty-acid--[acyl-carrier-protein] ligase
MAANSFNVAATRRTLWSALLDAVSAHGKNKVILEDPERQPLTYGRLVLGALVLGGKLRDLTNVAERVGVLLPNVQGLAVTVFGLTAYGRVPAMLNFTAGVKNLRAACEVGSIGTIVTSRRFVDQGKLDDVVAALAQGRRIVYLEDVRKLITSWDKLKGLFASITARSAEGSRLKVDEEAVVLFTSGTEGTPKGVVLSHANLVANAMQIFAHADGMLTAQDTVMNPLPAFHSFGLTAATLMPLLNGMKVVMYPSPLHYKQVPKLIGETTCTVLFGTDTFLQGYARAADAGDLGSVRIVIAGAERIKDETRRMWEPFGATICEGYGCTECAPVLACNTIGEGAKGGSVGRMVPGITHRLDPVEGIETGGRLFVQGPNIMLGYLLAERPGEIVAPDAGWHDTGDIVDIDEGGFITIKGRAKRFAKLGGEMVSLAAVETMVSGLWPGHNHVVVSLPDPKKGEQLVLVTEKPDGDRKALLKEAQAQGFPELWIPRAILVTQNIPVLGSGKVDYTATRELAQTMRTLL